MAGVGELATPTHRKGRDEWGTRHPTKPNYYDPKSIETTTEFVVPYVTVNV